MSTQPPRGPASSARPAMSDMQVRAAALQAAATYAGPGHLEGDLRSDLWVLGGLVQDFEKYIRTGVLVPPGQFRKADES